MGSIAGSLVNVASRLMAAGYDPDAARDVEHVLIRLAGRLGRSFLLASPGGVASWIVAAVNPETMTATLICGDQIMDAGPAELGALFGARGRLSA